MREWTDETTSLTVRHFDHPAYQLFFEYFRQPRHLSDGRVVCRAYKRHADPARRAKLHIAVDPDTGDIEPLPDHNAQLFTVARDGRWLVRRDANVYAIRSLDDKGEYLGTIPDDAPGKLCTITCDGRHAVLGEFNDRSGIRPPSDHDAANLWRFFNRPRSAKLWVLDLKTGKREMIHSVEGMQFIHHDASPTDPTLIRFALDQYDAHCQRIWLIGIDGNNLRKVRPQQRGELITHEFWWPGGEYIAFKYQDRRDDDTVDRLPWAEYAPVPTQIGLANTAGEQVYLSDPINHYHSHVCVSPDTSLLCGEGTDGRSFVYAARFAMDSPRIDFVPHATIHTEYGPFSKGQSVNAGFTTDNRWLLYNDTIDDELQACAVRVEV